METLVKTIYPEIVEGEFDYQSEAVWKIEREYDRAEDKIIAANPYETDKEFDILNFGNDKEEFDAWQETILSELAKNGYRKIMNGRNRVELHTPTHSVYYKLSERKIEIYSK